ncbi:glycosyltransferase family 39 protein [Humibacter ginsengisoli]
MTSTNVNHILSAPYAARSARAARVVRMSYRAPLAAAVVGLVALAISLLGSWAPSFRSDEAVSILSAERPGATLLGELVRADAAHGAYYSLLHVWIDFFGASAFATRLPSAIAVGLAAAGIVVLVGRYGGLRLGILSALIFAVLPGTTATGSEVRWYALGTAFAVWLSVLFLRLVTRRSTGVLPWACFAIAYAACSYAYLYLSLLALPFAAVLLWDARGRVRATFAAIARPGSAATADVAVLRSVMVRWMLATAAGAVLVSPLAYAAILQHGHTATVDGPAQIDLATLVVAPWFGRSPALAVVALGTLVALAVAGLVVWRRRCTSEVRRMLRTDRARLLLFAVAWLVLPMAAILAVNPFVRVYEARALSFTAPVLAVLLAVAIDGTARWIVQHRARQPGALSAPRTRLAAAASFAGVALIAAIAAPAYFGQRTPSATGSGSDWDGVAAIIHRHSKAGDDVVFDEDAPAAHRPRLAMHLYPQQFANVVDVTLAVPYENRDSLWDKTYSIPQVGSRIASGNGRVWLVEYRGKTGDADTVGMHQRVSALDSLGFSVVHSYRVHSDVVYLFTRGSVS